MTLEISLDPTTKEEIPHCRKLKVSLKIYNCNVVFSKSIHGEEIKQQVPSTRTEFTRQVIDNATKNPTPIHLKIHTLLYKFRTQHSVKQSFTYS